MHSLSSLIPSCSHTHTHTLSLTHSHSLAFSLLFSHSHFPYRRCRRLVSSRRLGVGGRRLARSRGLCWGAVPSSCSRCAGVAVLHIHMHIHISIYIYIHIITTHNHVSIYTCQYADVRIHTHRLAMRVLCISCVWPRELSNKQILL